jgi:hypothetical protein
MERSGRLKNVFAIKNWSINEIPSPTRPTRPTRHSPPNPNKYIIQHTCIYGKNTTFFGWYGGRCSRCKKQCPEEIQAVFVMLEDW